MSPVNGAKRLNLPLKSHLYFNGLSVSRICGRRFAATLHTFYRPRFARPSGCRRQDGVAIESVLGAVKVAPSGDRPDKGPLKQDLFGGGVFSRRSPKSFDRLRLEDRRMGIRRSFGAGVPTPIGVALAADVGVKDIGPVRSFTAGASRKSAQRRRNPE